MGTPAPRGTAVVCRPAAGRAGDGRTAPLTATSGVRDRDDEATTAAAVLVLLLQDLVLEVPGQQQHVVRLLLEQGLGSRIGMVHPGHEAPLLVDVAVDDEVDELGVDARRS